MSKKIVLLAILTTILSTVSFSIFEKNTYASSLLPDVQTFNMSPEDLSLGEISYTNDSKQKETILASVSSYDSKTEKTLTDKPFITLKQTKLTVNPNKKASIEYVITIPKDTPAGTYSNVILVQKQESSVINGNVAIIPSIGSLFVFHISDSTTTLDKLFYDQSDIQLIVKKKGLPYLFNTEFEYIYTNNSNFVFKPEGEIRIIDSKDNQLMERFPINEEKKALYPGESFSKSYSVNVWKDLNSIFIPKSIVSKTYSDIDGSTILNKIDLNILNQVIVIGGVIGVILLSLLGLLVSSIITKRKSKKEKVLSE